MQSSARVRVSSGFAAVGVLLVVVTALWPADWYPAAPLFAGLACIAVSHVLTPCQDQITRWWRARLKR